MPVGEMSPRYIGVALLLTIFVTTCESQNDFESFCSSGYNDTIKNLYVSRRGKLMNVILYWASDPARAASALFATILREGFGYQKIYLRRTIHSDLQSFAAAAPHNPMRRYEEVMLALAISWEPGDNPPWAPNKGAMCSLAGPRLEEFGVSQVPVQKRLYVHVAKHFRNQTECLDVAHWSFYTNDTALQKCGFTYTALSDLKKAVVYELETTNNETHIIKLKLKKIAEVLNFTIRTTNRSDLFQMLRTENSSFLYMDYDIWSGYAHVREIPQPFCLPNTGSDCLLEQSNAVSMRVGDVSLLIENAPALIQFAHNFTISKDAIREILEIESEGKHIEVAAHEWAWKHNVTENYKQLYDASNKIYEIAIFYCSNDPDHKIYDTLIAALSKGIIDDMYKNMFKFRPRRYLVNCSNVHEIKSKLHGYTAQGIKNRLIGAIVGSVDNISYVANSVDGANLPVMFYDAVGVDTSSSVSTWLTTGHSRHLALAMQHFILGSNWKRVAVLSDPTETAQRFFGDLKALGNIALGNHHVPLNLTKRDAEKVLKQLKSRYEDAHIILVNTNYKDAATILEAGASLGMSSTTEYAWIVREWRPNDKTADIRHFTFSFWCRCGTDPSNNSGYPGLRGEMDKLYPNCTWPPHAATIGDALFILLNGFNHALRKCPQIRDDLRNEAAVKTLEKSIIAIPTQGITQNFTYKGHSLEESVVFVDEWRGHRHSHLARWRINANTTKVDIEHEERTAYPQGNQPQDGSLHCFTPSGDPYLPTCHDWECGTALIFIILTPLTLLWVYRVLRRRLHEHEKKIIYEVMAQRQHRIAALSAGYLVDRSALTMHHELGAGRFGYVRLAMLRLPGKTPRYVAAKAQRENQDESEILHEACVLSSLNHENIIRLVGVCIDKEPPLVIMEVAFFGDLLQYLRDRRYLAEGASEIIQSEKCDEEVSHVSAESLTRLARQAASALGYLALRGVVHRDLRASNCMVDSNRTLKVADFGLARETKTTGTDGNTEYACRRRGLFPVLWMAPESLINGVFSAASDVWAFGVLVFELVTLGARPFGDTSPLRVMQYVASGGKPSMPRDASPQTVALARLCWEREPEKRPTAANVVAYLAERPYALRPAFDDDDKGTDVDSGCGESPMSELLPC